MENNFKELNMNINEMILNHGAGCFDELVESFSDEAIQKMNDKYIREDFKCDFDFKYRVAIDYVRNWLIEKIANDCTDNETQELFEIYLAM